MSAATWIRHLELRRALREALQSLARAGVPVLVVKGMVLAYELYDDVALRPISDVDLRVRPRDFVRAMRALRALGWRADYTSKQLGAVAFLTRGALVEIESTVGPPGLCGLTVADMLDRSVERTLPDDLVVREPDIVDHAVLLVVNAFKDKLVECPRWSVEDLEALGRHRLFDRTRFVARVRAAGISTVAWVVADWLSREEGSSTWSAVRDVIGPRPPRGGYARIMSRLARSRPHSMTTRVLARLGSDHLPMRIGALGATILGAAGSRVAALVDRGP